MKSYPRALRAAGVLTLIILISAFSAWGQQVSGTISGVVKDTQQAVVAGAKVTLTQPEMGLTREATTGGDGSFAFTLLQPADYHLTVEAAGFKKHEQEDIKIFASDRVRLPDIVLQIGQMAETVTVEAQAVQLQSQSAERSGVVTGRQVTELAVKTRNFFDLAITAPGVYYRPTGGSGMGNIISNGNRPDQNNLQVDGITNVDTGNNTDVLATMNVDQIAEFKILTNSQPAEIGRSSGAQVQVITKSGTRDFHGSGYWFHRHEGLNANNWRNNMEGRARNLFRYNYEGYTIGGPVLIPGTSLNKNRDKLFFFWSQEFQNSLVPNAVQSVTVPTAAQRTGDFSNTFNGSGTKIYIRDPLKSGACNANDQTACFTNNIIPGNRISADGQKILNFYPLPNRIGVDNNYNYQSQISDSQPRREQMIRGDYNINDKWRVYSRYLFTKSEINKAYGQWNANYNIPYAPMNFGNPGWSLITNLTTVINPTLTNEFIFGSSKNKLNIDPVDDTFKRSKLGLTYQMPFGQDSLDLIQNWRYGGVPNAPNTSFNGTPFRNFNHTWEWTDNVSKIMGAHTAKAGMYLHYSQKDQTSFVPRNGNIDFANDGSNPNNTGWAFSNALTGTYASATQANTILNGQYRSWNVEWFLQDTWKATSKLTLDLGLRFYWIQPQYDAALQTGSFVPELFNPANAAKLEGGKIVRGTAGFTNGVYTNGIGRAGKELPKGLMKDRGIHYAPRIGIAYQINDKTVLRTGGGVYYDRFQGNDVFDMLGNPPLTIQPTVNNGLLTDLASAASANLAPANVRGFDFAGHVPTTYNWNFSLQRELPGRVLFDIGYVGMRSLHNLGRYNLNTLPFGSAWLPQNNPAGNVTGLNTNAANTYRPYMGYGDVTISQFGTSSNYNGLQISANRRLSSSFTFGANYTWSKVLGTAGDRTENLHPTNYNVVNYGPLSYDVPHQFVLNYTWDLPKGARGFMDNWLGKGILNGWELSGITSFFAGEPDFINIGDLGNPYANGIVQGGQRNRVYTGSESVGPRPYFVGDPSGKKDIMAWIDTGVLRAPVVGSTGQESGQRPIRKPGVSNFDISIFKNFQFRESMGLQLRCEMFNAFNHTQFSDFNRTVNFNSAGQITNLAGPGNRFGFGAITAARDPRIIQLAARFRF